MSIASRIATVAKEAAAVTFCGGYAQMYNGKIERFPTGHQEAEKRNGNGRCTMARYHYADGSRLIFRWSENLRARYEVQEAKS
mgnify:CR=1 FL=1